ncbi:MAG: ATP-binding protein [Paludibacteraceae bacterium]|nr:ATP-binding protein [Paludibacteraceae bacterium]
MEELLHREYYTQQIAQWLGKQIIIVLTGQRRVGKSMCLRLLAQEKQADPNANIIYIDKEDVAFDAISTYEELNAYISEHFVEGKQNYILIDEVQDIIGFERSVRSWIKQPQTDVVITGSNAKMLSSELSTLLAARYIEIPIHALSYTEFLYFHQLTDSDEALEKYLLWGGLPYLRLIGLENTEQVKNYLQSVYDTIVLKDVVQREQIRNVTSFINLSRFVSDSIGKLVSPNSIMKYLRSQGENLSSVIIQNYLKYLCNAYLTYEVQRYDIHGKQLLENNDKYYFEDLGIRNKLVRTRQTNDIEKRIENAVYLNLLRLGYSVHVGQLRSAEIDFVAEKGEQTIYVQVAYLIADEETEIREFGNLKAIKNNHPKIVVSLNPLNTISDIEGIKHIHLRQFLHTENF